MSTDIIDFHSHILPGMDDGSRDIPMSLEMLGESARQGVTVQVLTPHYYPWKESIRSFLSRREESVSRLRSALVPGLPRVLIGAETAFSPHMTKEDLSSLCIEGSRLLLIELPFESWDDRVINEITSLSLDTGYHVVLAHVERYMGYKRNSEILSELSRLPIHIQLNAEAFSGFFAGRKMMPFFRLSCGVLLGSDAHNLTNRRPNLADGRRCIEKHLGRDFLARMDIDAATLLQKETAVR